MPTHYEKNSELPNNPDAADVNAFVPIGIRMREGETKLIKLVIPGLEPPLLFAKIDIADNEPSLEIVDKDDVDVIEEEGVDEDELTQPEAAPSEVEEEEDDLPGFEEEDSGEEIEYYKVTKDDGTTDVIEVSGIPPEREALLKRLREQYDTVEKTVEPSDDQDENSEGDGFKVDANIPGNPKAPSGWLIKGKDKIAVMAMDDESDDEALDRVSKEHPGYKVIKGATEPSV